MKLFVKVNFRHFFHKVKMSSGDVRGAMTPVLIENFKSSFLTDEKNILASNVCSKYDLLEMCLKRCALGTTNHIFATKVSSEIKPLANQKGTLTCWIYSALNAMRIPFAKRFELDEFEFSHEYVFFWHKLEVCNYFLHTVVQELLKGEAIDGRLISYLLQYPVQDAGQYDMFVNIILKYGIMPRKCFPISFHSEHSARMNTILQAKMREYVKNLHELIKSGTVDLQILAEKITDYMKEVYRILVILLGMPPDTFVWEYYEKKKVYKRIGPITPIDFYNEHIKPYYNVEDKVCLVNDPRPFNPFNEIYTVYCLGNMIGGRSVKYLNLDVEELIKFTLRSIENNEPVWFGCDYRKNILAKLGVADLNLIDYKTLFDTEVFLNMTKSDRLIFGDSCLTHAMLFTGATVDDDDKPFKFRVENSYGEEYGEKEKLQGKRKNRINRKFDMQGFLVMTTDWFKEFGFEVVVDKKYLSDHVLEMLQKEPKVLPAWDPMGALAS